MAQQLAQKFKGAVQAYARQQDCPCQRSPDCIREATKKFLVKGGTPNTGVINDIEKVAPLLKKTEAFQAVLPAAYDKFIRMLFKRVPYIIRGVNAWFRQYLQELTNDLVNYVEKSTTLNENAKLSATKVRANIAEWLHRRGIEKTEQRIQEIDDSTEKTGEPNVRILCEKVIKEFFPMEIKQVATRKRNLYKTHGSSSNEKRPRKNDGSVSSNSSTHHSTSNQLVKFESVPTEAEMNAKFTEEKERRIAELNAELREEQAKQTSACKVMRLRNDVANKLSDAVSQKLFLEMGKNSKYAELIRNVLAVYDSATTGLYSMDDKEMWSLSFNKPDEFKKLCPK